MSRVDVTDAAKRYGTVAALDGVTMTFRDGEFFGLLGPSGSGKTTLLRAIAGFVDARIAAQIADRRRAMSATCRCIAATSAWCSRTMRCSRIMTVADNVAFGLEVRGMPREEIAQRVEEMLALVRLAGLERAQAEAALRRPAAARGAGARAGDAAEGAAARRAAGRARQASAPGDAGRAAATSSARSASPRSSSPTTRRRR